MEMAHKEIKKETSYTDVGCLSSSVVLKKKFLISPSKQQ